MCASSLIYPKLGNPTGMDRAAMRFGAKRYIAGTDLESAITVARGFNKRGMPVILDLLGEAGNGSGTKGERIIKTREVGNVVAQLAADEGLKIAMAIRPGQFENDYTALRNMVTVLTGMGIFVWIDMEKIGAVTPTIDSYRQCAIAHPGMVGLAMQAYLLRTENDVRKLLEFSNIYGVPIELRFVRGVYVDESDMRTLKEMHENLARLVHIALKSGIEQVKVHMASHDPEQITRAILLREMYGERMASNQILLGVYTKNMLKFLESDQRANQTPRIIYEPFGPDVAKYISRRNGEAGGTLRGLALMRFRERGNTKQLADILDLVQAGICRMDVTKDHLPFEYGDLRRIIRLS